MNFLNRTYQDLLKYLKTGKVLVLYGARQVGKTTLLKNFLKTTPLQAKFVSGDNLKIQTILGSREFAKIQGFCEGYQLLIIDEAQNIPQIGLGLKIIVDNVPKIKVLVTGSSSFDLANQVGEPLVGRKKTLTLYPFSQAELLQSQNKFELQERLAEYLIYGSYPEVILAKTKKQKIEYLLEISEAYLFKDILALEKIKNSQTLMQLVQLLALQVGSEVSLNELANKLRISVKTVARYLDLLEKSFVLKSLGGFRSNLRRAVTQKRKYYFVDLGIRNAVINNFNSLELRADVGALWENFCFLERTKLLEYTRKNKGQYFWRTYAKQEIDYLEEGNGKLGAFEFKWSPQPKIKIPPDFLRCYPDIKLRVINPENYLQFVLGSEF